MFYQFNLMNHISSEPKILYHYEYFCIHLIGTYLIFITIQLKDQQTIEPTNQVMNS